jgi:hypothetical protein
VARAQARQSSRTSGQAAATNLLTLVQHKAMHAGFLVVAPVYLRGAPLDTVAARHRAVIGEIAAVFKVKHLIDAILGADGLLNAPGMSINIYDGPGPSPQNLAFRYGVAPQEADRLPLIPRWLVYDTAEPVSRTFDLAGSPWHMEVSASRHAVLDHAQRLAVCVAGRPVVEPAGGGLCLHPGVAQGDHRARHQ